jgi:3-phosphoshikimate 1-carboxyvinyltransferase
MTELRINGKRSVHGEITVPGDKSISHRSVILGSIAEGKTSISGFLESSDCLNTIGCFSSLGVPIAKTGEASYEIQGVGLDGLKEPSNVLDVGNSGTGIRLISGVLAGQDFYTVITGDESIRRRPMDRIARPLREMGAKVLGRENGRYAPLTIMGGNLKAVSYTSPVASAQIKSAVMLAGLFANGITSLTEPALSRNHTELMLEAFGADIQVDGLTVSVKGQPHLKGQEIRVPGDISSAAFFIVAAIITKGSRVRIENVGINPTRTGILDVLGAMGAKIRLENKRTAAGEPVADIVAESSNLSGTVIGEDLIPSLIDEIPIIAVAASVAEGETVIEGAHELRVKESDRIHTVCQEISKFGVHIDEQPDGMVIHGSAKLHPAECESHGDHRIAMSAAVAALAAEGETVISNTDNIRTSFPNFEEILDRICTN